MPGEKQDEDDTPEDEQSIGEESDEFVQADAEPENAADESADTAEAAPQDDESEADVSETPDDVDAEPAEADDAEPAEADDAESEDSEVDAEETEPAEAEVEDVDEPPEEAAADEKPEEAAADEKPQKGPDEVFCTSCGKPIKKQAEVCPRCGVRQEGSSSSGSVEKNPGIAAIASLILPGAGDLYNGELDRAAIVFIAWFVGGIVWGTIITIIGVITLGIGLILAPLYLVTNFVSAYLSYQRTEQINAGELEV